MWPRATFLWLRFLIWKKKNAPHSYLADLWVLKIPHISTVLEGALSKCQFTILLIGDFEKPWPGALALKCLRFCCRDLLGFPLALSCLIDCWYFSRKFLLSWSHAEPLMLMSINFKKYCVFEFRRSWKSIQSGFPSGASGIYKDLSLSWAS